MTFTSTPKASYKATFWTIVLIVVVNVKSITMLVHFPTSAFPHYLLTRTSRDRDITTFLFGWSYLRFFFFNITIFSFFFLLFFLRFWFSFSWYVRWLGGSLKCVNLVSPLFNKKKVFFLISLQLTDSLLVGQTKSIKSFIVYQVPGPFKYILIIVYFPQAPWCVLVIHNSVLFLKIPAHIKEVSGSI